VLFAVAMCHEGYSTRNRHHSKGTPRMDTLKGHILIMWEALDRRGGC
jgi:hypothetical protein